MNYPTVVPRYHFGEWQWGRLEEGSWRIFFFPLKIEETFRLALWGRPKPAVIMGMRKGARVQAGS